MEKRKSFSGSILFYSGLFCLLLSGFVCQLLLGACNPRWFAFPVNIIIVLSQLYLVYICRVKWGQSAFWKWFSGKSFTTVILLLLIAFVLLMGLIPQQPASGNSFLSFTGLHRIRTHWVFIILLFLLTWHLVAVLFGNFRKVKSGKLLFILFHGGFLLAVWGGFFGSADEQNYKMIVGKGDSSNIAYLDKNTVVKLPFEIRLDDCKIEHYHSGEPKLYSAQLQVRKNREVKTGEVRVNHPFRYGMFDLYLQNVNIASDPQNSYCIIQIIKQPWKILIFCGILMMLSGSCVLFLKGNSISKKTDKNPGKAERNGSNMSDYCSFDTKKIRYDKLG